MYCHARSKTYPLASASFLDLAVQYSCLKMLLHTCQVFMASFSFRAPGIIKQQNRATMASTPGSSHGETAVPTLKVMRLQSPDLSQVSYCEFDVESFLCKRRAHNSSILQPIAGSLDSKCLLSTSLALPDSFGGRYLLFSVC